MKSQILLLIIVTFATACNSQEKEDMKHKGIIFKDEIFDLDDLKFSLEKDTSKLNIVWNTNNEPNNFSDSKSTVTVTDKTGKEFQVSVTEEVIDSTLVNYIIELKDEKLKKTVWKYSPNQALSIGNGIKAVVKNNKLIVAVYCPIATGSDLVCIDIYSGKEIWHGDIKQIRASHSQYSNVVHIKAFDNKIILAGNELGYRYLQVIDINTGANLFSTISDIWNNNSENASILINKKEALEIANADAQKAYRDLSIYNIKAELIDEEWHIDYNLSDPQMLGGGPHYIISAKTGKILSFRYEQ